MGILNIAPSSTGGGSGRRQQLTSSRNSNPVRARDDFRNKGITSSNMIYVYAHHWLCTPPALMYTQYVADSALVVNRSHAPQAVLADTLVQHNRVE